MEADAVGTSFHEHFLPYLFSLNSSSQEELIVGSQCNHTTYHICVIRLLCSNRVKYLFLIKTFKHSASSRGRIPSKSHAAHLMDSQTARQNVSVFQSKHIAFSHHSNVFRWNFLKLSVFVQNVAALFWVGMPQFYLILPGSQIALQNRTCRHALH